MSGPETTVPAIPEPDHVPPTRPTWVFDLDGCLIDSPTGKSLRPGARELLDQLHSSRSAVLLWSAGGAEYARERARQHGIERFFDGFHAKDCRDGDGRYVTCQLSVRHSSTIFVDDRPEDMPIGAEVVTVHPYISLSPDDRGLHPVAHRAGLRFLLGEANTTAQLTVTSDPRPWPLREPA